MNLSYNYEEVVKELYPQYTYEEVKWDFLPSTDNTISGEEYIRILPPLKRTIIRDYLDLGGDNGALQIVQEKHSDKLKSSTIYDIVTTYEIYVKTLI